MPITISAATARISRQLPEAELSLDTALLASARLMEAMLLARSAEGVQTFAGQNALMRLARSQRSLIESQNDMIRVHRELLRTGQEVKAVGDSGDCPNSASAAVEPVRLQA
ncbi:hypothetical protein [Novosphingobium album (ex Hu et al. 2023)]|uniref:Uncharacterized protein n=1 Tax=Novosphingobium album (ex Hu et al. 2023) TaxID=2930093 RepID=A0ABT0AZH1_9SPHN|nr:hypothetical protein [Novosphingobium album (ex Hu et al. 2023)]MCJ2178035.1 hypothetical protein [Novosphingobium album (ex Hu et al. 2023)]